MSKQLSLLSGISWAFVTGWLWAISVDARIAQAHPVLLFDHADPCVGCTVDRTEIKRITLYFKIEYDSSDVEVMLQGQPLRMVPTKGRPFVIARLPGSLGDKYASLPAGTYTVSWRIKHDHDDPWHSYKFIAAAHVAS